MVQRVKSEGGYQTSKVRAVVESLVLVFNVFNGPEVSLIMQLSNSSSPCMIQAIDFIYIYEILLVGAMELNKNKDRVCPCYLLQ